MARKPTPRWQPLSYQPFLGHVIQEGLESAAEMEVSLKHAAGRPYVVDDTMLNRVIKLYSEQRDDLWLYEEQFARWEKETLTSILTLAEGIRQQCPRGVGPFSLLVDGSGFAPQSRVEWNGKTLPTSYVSGSRLSATVSTGVNTALSAYPGSVQISAVNPDGTGGSATLSIAVPTPVLKQFSPASLPHGSKASKLTLTGATFAPGAVVHWNGAALTTTFLSTTKLTAAIPASDLATKGTAQVSVSNPSGGGVSQALTFTIK